MSEEAAPREAVFVWEGPARHRERLADDPAFLAKRMQRSAAAGNAQAQLGWAHMLLEGHGTERDPAAAFRWFQLAARSHNTEAINMLGRCHELGWGTAPNTHMAAHCYRAAADQGHAWASFNLAMLMLARDGAEGDKSEILALLVRSARRGNAKAMNSIGQACEEGWRAPPKIMPARRWYMRAARRGCYMGAFNSARHLMDDGDVDGAVLWLQRAVASAPARFCSELGSYLAEHQDDRLREVAAMALERARSMPERLAVAAPEMAARPAQKAEPSGRKPRSMDRVWRALTGAKRSRPV